MYKWVTNQISENEKSGKDKEKQERTKQIERMGQSEKIRQKNILKIKQSNKQKEDKNTPTETAPSD